MSSKRYLRRLDGYGMNMLLFHLLGTARSLPPCGLVCITDHCPDATRWSCLAAWLARGYVTVPIAL